MRLAIMQPYFFPYPGHFSLIAACDRWIVFDISQYTPRTWMNRNLILHPSGGYHWMTVPLANSSIHISTHEARILNPAAARRRVLGQFSHYRYAPFYRPVIAMVNDVFDEADASLVHLNVRGLAAVCRYIGLAFEYQVCSELGLPLWPNLGSGGWAPAICAALGADSYVNPLGGRALFDRDTFARHGVGLQFAETAPFTYQAGSHGQVCDLSILDALMWNPPENVLAAVRRVRLVD